MRTFVFTDEKSNKFWHIELQGQIFTVTFGRVGTNGQTQTKAFADGATAKKEHDKLVAEKLKKGYVETTPGSPPPPAKPTSTEQQALEKALLAHPDEVAAHSAYGDYLVEVGDPRGELVQVQLALEDATRSKADRDALRKRETALLKKYARDWMGDAGRFLVGEWSGADKPYHFSFVRGWLDYVRALPVPEPLIAALAQAPEARMLRRLEVVYDMRYHPFEFNTDGPRGQVRKGEQAGEIYDAFPTLPYLAESPYLTNLRVLKYGFSDDHKDGPSHSTMVDPFGSNSSGAGGAEKVIDLLNKCPRLEELYLNTDLDAIDTLFAAPQLGGLRVFQYYYGTDSYRDRANAYPLSTLAENKALKNLTTLRFHPGRDAEIGIDEFDALINSKNLPALAHLQVHTTTFGDEGANRIIASGILKRLKTLDIGYGYMTDAGAQVLATSPDFKKLEVLNVARNALTPVGIAALTKTGVRIIADAQHGATDADEDQYYHNVDWE